MHVIGLKDEWVPPERSQVLANAFLTPFATATTVVHEHPGGHLVPQDSTNRRPIVDFIVGNCIK
jgi:predicted esterase